MSSLERVQVQRGKQGRRGKDAMLGFRMDVGMTQLHLALMS